MKILLIDDHPLILTALESVIRGLGDDVTVIGVDSATAARVALTQDPDIDLVLLDLSLGDADGFEVLTEFRNAYPALPVVVVSASDRASDVVRSIDLGAMGFVPKRASSQSLFEALRLVMSGGIFVPSMAFGDHGAAAPGDGDATPSLVRMVGGAVVVSEQQRAPTLESLGLTPRQREVLTLLLQGKPNKLIAREMRLSVETVKDHVAAVLRTLGVTSRTQAVLAVSQMGQPEGFQAWKPSRR